MKTAIALGLAVLGLAGCEKPSAPAPPAAPPSPPPAAADIETNVRGQVPSGLQVRQFRVVSVDRDDQMWRIEFAIEVAANEPRFETVDLDAALAALQWVKNPNGGAAPTVVRAVATPTENISTTGRLTAHRRGTWQFAGLQWDVAPTLPGRPRQDFPANAVCLGTAAANEPVLRYLQQGRFAKLPVTTDASYRQIKLDSVELDSLLFEHTRGIGQVRWDELTPGMQALFHFDVARAQALLAQRAQAAVRQTRSVANRAATTASAATPSVARPANPDEAITAYLKRYTTSPNTISLRTRSPEFDEFTQTWKVEFDYSFHQTDGRSPGGRRVEGASYASFRGEQLIQWGGVEGPAPSTSRSIPVIPRSPLPPRGGDRTAGVPSSDRPDRPPPAGPR